MKPPIRITFWCCCLVWLMAFPVCGNAAWFTNQGGKDSGIVCKEPDNTTQFTTMTGGQAYLLLGDNACGYTYCTGSSDTSPWTYNVTGSVIVKNTTSSTETFTVTGNSGSGCLAGGTWPNSTFSGCSTVTLYSGNIVANETKIIPFLMANSGIPYSDSYAFYVSVELSGSGSCVGGAYVTWEHD